MIGEHPYELTFYGESGFILVSLCSQGCRRGRLTFSDIFDKNVGMRRMTISRPHAPSSYRLSLWGGCGSGL